MTVIATETARIGALIKQMDAPHAPELYNDVVTVNEASQQTYAVGTVLGKITASGKYIICKQAASDGSQVPAAVYIGDSFGNIGTITIPATTDTKVVAITRGKIVLSQAALVVDASFTAGALLNGLYASLKAINIICEQSV
jgi:hypothetical protein